MLLLVVKDMLNPLPVATKEASGEVNLTYHAQEHYVWMPPARLTKFASYIHALTSEVMWLRKHRADITGTALMSRGLRVEVS